MSSKFGNSYKIGHKVTKKNPNMQIFRIFFYIFLENATKICKYQNFFVSLQSKIEKKETKKT